MTTNDEIKKKYQDEEKGIYYSFNTTKVIDTMLNEARADTAQQIFKELDKIVCKNHKGSATFGIAKNMDVIHVEDYEALKKKHNIEE